MLLEHRAPRPPLNASSLRGEIACGFKPYVCGTPATPTMRKPTSPRIQLGYIGRGQTLKSLLPINSLLGPQTWEGFSGMGV